MNEFWLKTLDKLHMPIPYIYSSEICIGIQIIVIIMYLHIVQHFI